MREEDEIDVMGISPIDIYTSTMIIDIYSYTIIDIYGSREFHGRFSYGMTIHTLKGTSWWLDDYTSF